MLNKIRCIFIVSVGKSAFYNIYSAVTQSKGCVLKYWTWHKRFLQSFNNIKQQQIKMNKYIIDSK